MQEFPPDATHILVDAVYSSSASRLRAYSTLKFIRLDEVFRCMTENHGTFLLMVLYTPISLVEERDILCVCLWERCAPCGQEVNSMCDSSQDRREGRTTRALQSRPERAELWRPWWV